MAKKMLIDAAHPEETRVVVLDGQRVDDFDFETQNKKQLRGNIYLAKVTRVEPSLQAAFVEYGGNRHGFLAFGEIHPDYYQIPVADREALKAEIEGTAIVHNGDAEEGEEGAHAAEDDEDENAADDRRRRLLTRRYRIQEVIRRRQIMLVQVVKEERGNKGAALTTYLSLAGRYCVLMPNTGRGGGISRKITNGADRKRLKKIAVDLDVPKGMGLIIRTAGAKRTKTEIKRDYEYLLRAWENICDLTLRSVAPALIYEESSLVKRAIRDLYDKDVGEIYVEGEAAYREAKDFVRMLMPSHAKKVHHYREPTPIFTGHNVERQLESIYSPVVNLKSGGYIVINQTEALVAIDVNSGRATRERNIEATAFKTNLEAADEAARQMRLRDLAGLVVIDFIDMEEAKNDRAVEKRLKDALRFDRARVQTGKISTFGLMEMSRQRRRTGVLEGSSHICAHCGGAGRVRSIESSALRLLRALDDEAQRSRAEVVEARAPTDVALYILNEKREALSRIEVSRGVSIRIIAAANLSPPDFELASHGERRAEVEQPAPQARADISEADAADELVEDEIEETEDEDGEERVVAEGESAPQAENGDRRRRRRRGRRGGRRQREEGAPGSEAAEAGAEVENAPEGEAAEGESAEGESEEFAPADAAPAGERTGRRRRRRRRGRREGGPADESAPMTDEADADGADEESEPEAIAEAPESQPYPAPATPIHAPAPAPAFAIAAAAPPAPALTEAPVEDEPAEHAAAEVGPQEVPAPAPEVDYAPDQERREKFFARLSRWGKKEAS